MKLERYRPTNGTGKTFHYRLKSSPHTYFKFCGNTYGSNVTIYTPEMLLLEATKKKPLMPCKICLKAVKSLSMQVADFTDEMLPILVRDIETTVHEYDMAETVFGHKLLQVVHNR